jgi:hypothetical protein
VIFQCTSFFVALWGFNTLGREGPFADHWERHALAGLETHGRPSNLWPSAVLSHARAALNANTISGAATAQLQESGQ